MRPFPAILLLVTACTVSATTAPAPPQASDSRIAASREARPTPKPKPVVQPPPRDGVLRVAGSELEVIIDDRIHSVTKAQLHDWVRQSADWIAQYYEGDFPVPGLEVNLVGRGRGGIGFGQHQDGRWIRISVGRRTSTRSLNRDWVMVHEMLHATFPDLPRTHRWMQEGLSTYLEPIVRARVGNIDEQEIWSDWVRQMEYGRPEAGDRGLDRTHTWGRTYWGGALFWMVVDVEIRRRTDNRKDLGDALRGIVARGGNGRANWSTRKVVQVGDEATGTTVLADLYREMALAPGDVDLDQLFRDLGIVRRSDGSVKFNERAPMAHIRRAMVAP